MCIVDYRTTISIVLFVSMIPNENEASIKSVRTLF